MKRALLIAMMTFLFIPATSWAYPAQKTGSKRVVIKVNPATMKKIRRMMSTKSAKVLAAQTEAHINCTSWLTSTTPKGLKVKANGHIAGKIFGSKVRYNPNTGNLVLKEKGELHTLAIGKGRSAFDVMHEVRQHKNISWVDLLKGRQSNIKIIADGLN